MGSLKRTFAHFLFASLLTGTAFAGPLTGPIDPTLPIDLPPTKPALPGMPSIEPIMIESRLGFMISTPIIAFNNNGTLSYSAATDLLSVDATPLAILLNDVDPPGIIFPGAGGADLLINIEIDNMGNLIGGVPGDDLIVRGAVDLTGDLIPDIDGVLLTGEVTEYMGVDSGGTTDFHSYRFAVTGGLLAGPFGSDVALELTSEMSDFVGNYHIDFSGEAKGNIGVVECTGTIGDFVWLDLNGDGIQDDGEPGIGGVQVILTDAQGNLIDTETTMQNGFYQFTGLCAGDYIVSINPDSLPPDVAPTLIGAPGSNDETDSNDPDGTPVTLPDNNSMDPDTDFGYVPVTSALGDYVWEDLNMDGIQDSNEPPIEGVMVNLYNCEGEFLASTTTDAFGFYQFTNLSSGCYVVEFIQPDGFVFTLMDQNGEALDSDPDPTTGFTDPVFLGSGETNPDVDAGLFRPASAELGDRFWQDLNGNGIQDPGEPGIGGVTVNLYDCDGNLLDSTTTEPNGMYLFADLPAGCYVVGFEPPADCILTTQDAGMDDTADSDADPLTGLTAQIDLADMESDLTWDGGCYYPAGLGDFVWNDLNQNGIQDNGEPGIPDLLVVLLDGDMLPTGLTTTTGPDGEYEFTGLPPGSYFVQFTSPAGFVFTLQDIGADDTDSDANGTGKSDKVTLESGEFDPTIDAGVYVPDNPSISIEKSTNGFDADVPTGPFVPNGDPVMWEYFVENTGNVTLTNVMVVDDQGVMVNCPQTTLTPGETMTCTGNGDATVDQYQNLGTVSGDPPQGPPVDDDDPSHYFGADPSIDIEKATNGVDADLPTGPFITPGANVSWTYVVHNTGNVTLTDVMVSDDQNFTVTCPLSTLLPDQIMTCTANGIAVVGQYANVGMVTGNPPPGAGDPVEDEDPSHYFGALPGIDIEKATNGVDADTPTGPVIANGGDVTWTYVVTNTGNVDLTNVMVTDNQGVTVDCGGQNTLAANGGTFTCMATGMAQAGQYANIGLVAGTPPVGDPVTDSDPSHYFGADPSIDIEKATNGEDADNPTGPTIPTGGAVTWTYVVTNTGNVDLTNVMVTDNQGVTVDCNGQNTLAANGGTFTCMATGMAQAGQYANIGLVSGTPPAGDPVNDSDPSHYFGADPSIDIEKATNGEDADDPTGPFIEAGGAVTWTYVVTNTGNVPLTNVMVSDDQGVAVDCGGQSTLAANGGTFTCTATGTATAGQYANMGDVIGTPPVGAPVTDRDPSHYFGVTPGIDIEKATNGEDADMPTGPSIDVGNPVIWTYVVTNTSNVPLTAVMVTDDQGVAVDCNGQTTLAAAGQAGDSFTCTASGTATLGQYANIGSVVGTPPVGPPVTDTDPSHYIGIELTEMCVLAAIPNPVYSTSGSDHAFTLPGIDTHTEFLPDPGSFVENVGAGTAVLSGRLGNRSNPANGFDVVVNLSGATNVAPPGSPKRELRDSAYSENGGPVDTSTFRYYTDFSGTLVGFGDYAGSVIDITPTGPAFQLGFGANNKNSNFGASAWFIWNVVSQPNNGNFPATGEGDINVDIREDCTPPDCVPGDFADHFGGDRFTNNDGSLDWSGPWIEDDVAGTGPGAGNAKIWGGLLILKDSPDTGTEPSLAREADLSQFTSATLTFDFWTSSHVDTSDAVTVEISNDGGVTYQTLEVFTNISGSSDGSRSYDISGYISPQTRVRFRVSTNYGGDKETFKVDNLRIEGDCEPPPPQCTPGDFADHFGGDRFTNNDGSLDWSGSWIEYDVAGTGPGAGNAKVWGGYLILKDSPDTGTDPSLAREADLSQFTSATLSFDFWTSSFVDTTDAVTVEISNDGGATYQTLEVFTNIDGASDGSRSYDISGYISSQTRVRFRVSNLYGADKETFKVDNLRIEGDCN